MAFIAPVLALVGGIAVITFVKLYGMLFLGTPRDPAAAHGHEAPFAMLLPMVLLAVLCLAGGIAAPLLARLVMPVVGAYSGLGPVLITGLVTTVPLATIGLLNGILLCGILAIWLIWRFLANRQPVAASTTWGCGYLAPTPRIQYTGSAFAELASGIFGGGELQSTRLPGLEGAFPGATLFAPPAAERFLDRLLIPCMSGIDWCFAWLRRMQGGHLYLYMLYIFVTLFVLMVWSYL
jgi:hydrogenase-4 component B